MLLWLIRVRRWGWRRGDLPLYAAATPEDTASPATSFVCCFPICFLSCFCVSVFCLCYVVCRLLFVFFVLFFLRVVVVAVVALCVVAFVCRACCVLRVFFLIFFSSISSPLSVGCDSRSFPSPPVGVTPFTPSCIFAKHVRIS